MKGRHLICCITAAVLTGGCVPAASEKMIQTGQSPTAAETQDGKAEYETEQGETGRQNEIEEKRQFADGFGLIEAGSSRVYQLAEQETPFTESELARADLVFAAQQAGKFWFTAVITDYSAKEADEETVLRELGHNPAYFRIEGDEESGQETFYGYSPYLALINDVEQSKPVRIEGKNIEKVQYAPSRLTQKTSSLSRLPSGRFIMNFGYSMEARYSFPGEPEGAYRLYLPGFEEPVVFKMEAAPVLEEGELSDEIFSEEILLKGAFAEGMSGAAERDRYGMAVRAKQEGERITAELYTWSDQGYLVNPQKMKLYYLSSEPERERFACPVLWENPYNWQEDPAVGCQGGAQGMRTVFEIPEKAREEIQTGKEGSFEAVLEGARLVGMEESQQVNIPVPRSGEAKPLNQTVSFRDSQIRLLQVTAQQRTETEKEESEIDADALLHVSASVIDNSEEHKFTFMLIGRESDSETVSYARTGWPEFPDKSGEQQPDTVMTGFSLLSSGNEESVSVTLRSPTYWCPETVIVPLEIDNLNL